MQRRSSVRLVYIQVFEMQSHLEGPFRCGVVCVALELS